jgi:hypothetical protein
MVIIPTFVLVGVMGRGERGGGGRTAMKIDGETVTFDRLWEYQRAYQVMVGSRGTRPAEMLQLHSAVSGILQQAKLAEKWGVQVSTAQLQDTIRNVMSRVLGTKNFTDAQYRAALEDRRVSRPVFEELVTKIIAGNVLGATASGVGHMTDEELFLAYCREKDRIKLQLKDFHVTTYEKDVKKSGAPTEEELKSYFEERKDLSLERELALKTEPEVAIEYGFVDSESAGRLARTLRRADRAVGFDGGLAGAGGALCGRIAAAALSASYEDRLLKQYESDKRSGLYRIRPKRPARTGVRPKRIVPPARKTPKRAPPGKTPTKTKPKGKQGRVLPAGGAGLASMLVIPALGAAASNEAPSGERREAETPARESGQPPGPIPPSQLTLDQAIPPGSRRPGAAAAPGRPKPPKERFEPFKKVRRQVEKKLAESMADDAARTEAQKLFELAREWSRLRLVEPEAFLAGVALGACPGTSAAGGIVERVEFARACRQTGALHGVTGVGKAEDLKAPPALGDLKSLPESAVGQGKAGRQGTLNWPTGVENGSVVWRVADYVRPRRLPFDEAKVTIRKRIIHTRAAKLARKAAEKFRDDVEQGKADVAKMRLTGSMGMSDPRGMPSEMMKPFALLGARELAPEPIAIERIDLPGAGGGRSMQAGNAKVAVDKKELTGELAVELEEGGMPAQEARAQAKRLADEAYLDATGRFRVGLVAERRSPSFAQFKNDTRWRTGRSVQYLPDIRNAFLQAAWGEIVAEKVQIERSQEYQDYLGQLDQQRRERQQR